MPRARVKKSAKPSAADCRDPTKSSSATTIGPIQGAATMPIVSPMKKAPSTPSPTRPTRRMSGAGTRKV